MSELDADDAASDEAESLTNGASVIQCSQLRALYVSGGLRSVNRVRICH